MKNQNIMITRSIPKMSKARLIRSVLALGAFALIMQVSLPRAQAYDLSSLSGAYADSGSGFASEPGPPGNSAPSYGVGLWTFDGAGHFTASLVLDSVGGTIYPNISGTYSVNASGTGTIDWVSFGIQRIRAFVIGDGVKQIRYVHTDPTVAQTFGGTMVKQ